MKKVYIKPILESATCFNDVQPLMHSDDHMSAKGINFDDDSEVDNNDMEIKNLWDD